MAAILFLPVWVLLQLACVMLAAMLIPRLLGSGTAYFPPIPAAKNNEKMMDLIIQVIGLVSSVLGIISFFLDHMK
jgi:xanthine/uracil permease